jgi:hypothetical protein
MPRPEYLRIPVRFFFDTSLDKHHLRPYIQSDNILFEVKGYIHKMLLQYAPAPNRPLPSFATTASPPASPMISIQTNPWCNIRGSVNLSSLRLAKILSDVVLSKASYTLIAQFPAYSWVYSHIPYLIPTTMHKMQ